MNILFLTLVDFDTIEERGIYQDLLREFSKKGHYIYIISPVEKRKSQKTKLIKSRNITILKLKIGNIQKTNVIEKGVSTLKIEPQYIYAIKKYFSNVKFDLVLYSTPPITFCKAIRYVKNRDGAHTFLLLKDIFPQNAVDMEMLSKTGIKSIVYNYFRAKEKKLYNISDRIGCTSDANIKYVLEHNINVSKEKVTFCANSVEPLDKSINSKIRNSIRKQYGIPVDKTVFVYGGNLGKPQGIDHLIRCLETQKNNSNLFFLIVGSGTEYKKIEKYIIEFGQNNIALMKQLPKEDYDTMVGACDVGMVFLDYRFTVPNTPSRILSYMQAKLPILNVTDASTDVGDIAIANNFGWSCKSRNIDDFVSIINEIQNSDLKSMGQRGYEYLLKNYDVKQSYKTICEGIIK